MELYGRTEVALSEALSKKKRWPCITCITCTNKYGIEPFRLDRQQSSQIPDGTGAMAVIRHRIAVGVPRRRCAARVFRVSAVSQSSPVSLSHRDNPTANS